MTSGRTSDPPAAAGTVLDRSFYETGSVALAPLVLNKLLVRRNRRGRVTMAGRVVEVEAYTGAEDPASHAYKGPTPRNAVMFGPAGHLYVYFTYGMHWCANLVCLPEGTAEAILIRALSPVSGIEAMRAARGEHITDRNLLSGPARLCQAFGITGAEDGANLVLGDKGLVLMDDGVPAPKRPATSGRVGISPRGRCPVAMVGAGRPERVEGSPGTQLHAELRRDQRTVSGSGHRRRGRASSDLEFRRARGCAGSGRHTDLAGRCAGRDLDGDLGRSVLRDRGRRAVERHLRGPGEIRSRDGHLGPDGTGGGAEPGDPRWGQGVGLYQGVGGIDRVVALTRPRCMRSQ